jgi:hypothetical protein
MRVLLSHLITSSAVPATIPPGNPGIDRLRSGLNLESLVTVKLVSRIQSFHSVGDGARHDLGGEWRLFDV